MFKPSEMVFKFGDTSCFK